MDILNKMKVEKKSELESSTVRVGSEELHKMWVAESEIKCSYFKCLEIVVGKCSKSEDFTQLKHCVSSAFLMLTRDRRFRADLSPAVVCGSAKRC